MTIPSTEAGRQYVFTLTPNIPLAVQDNRKYSVVIKDAGNFSSELWNRLFDQAGFLAEPTGRVALAEQDVIGTYTDASDSTDPWASFRQEAQD